MENWKTEASGMNKDKRIRKKLEMNQEINGKAKKNTKRPSNQEPGILNILEELGRWPTSSRNKFRVQKSTYLSN